MMTRKEAMAKALSCRGRIYTTDELWEDDENCILSDALGNLIYGNGELVESENDLPLDGWWDATDNEECYEDNNGAGNRNASSLDIGDDSVLWDPDDM